MYFPLPVAAFFQYTSLYQYSQPVLISFFDQNFIESHQDFFQIPGKPVPASQKAWDRVLSTISGIYFLVVDLGDWMVVPKI